MTDFKNGQELLEVCKKKQCSISEVMKQREIEGTSSTKKEVEDKKRKALAIMKEAAAGWAISIIRMAPTLSAISRIRL